MGQIGWTAAEYAQCPDLASRLHSRILDLEDGLQEAMEALPENGGEWIHPGRELLVVRRRIEELLG